MPGIGYFVWVVIGIILIFVMAKKDNDNDRRWN